MTALKYLPLAVRTEPQYLVKEWKERQHPLVQRVALAVKEHLKVPSGQPGGSPVQVLVHCRGLHDREVATQTIVQPWMLKHVSGRLSLIHLCSASTIDKMCINAMS